MAATYPGAVKNFSSIVNGVTKLVAALFNSPYEEVTAIETELGTNPKGSYADVKTRLDSTTTLGAWVDKLTSYGAQQAATDGFVTGSATGALDLWGYTDAATNPTVARFRIVSGNTGDYNTFTMPVKKGDYWKIVLTTGTMHVIFWIPLGS